MLDAGRRVREIPPTEGPEMSIRPLQLLPPTEALDLESGLSLIPRLKLLLTIFRSDPSVKPIDEWKLKTSIIEFLKSSFSLSVLEEDVQIRKSTDLKKRKREDPVASGSLYIRDLGFFTRNSKKYGAFSDENNGDPKVLEKRFLEWKSSVVGKMDGMELNLEGVKFRLNVEVPISDDFERLRESWEEFYASEVRAYYSRGARKGPDTLVLEGVPSRWFAEPRVSSKPSMLVTHTIFSAFGKIRKLNVAADNDLGKTAEDATGGAIMSGLHCKIWVQFEKFEDFCNALKVLCGRSMHKQGSHLRADYVVGWDKHGHFPNIQQRDTKSCIQERGSSTQGLALNSKNDLRRLRSEVSRFDSHEVRPKRFRE